jgi:hypothetical protein
MVLYLNHMAINCTGLDIEKNKIWTKQIIRLKIKLHKSPVIFISEKQDTPIHNIFRIRASSIPKIGSSKILVSF